MSAGSEAVIVPVSAMPRVPGQCPHPHIAVGGMRAEPGDTLAIDGVGMVGLPRLGIVIAVYGKDGAPPYLVRWTAGDYESTVCPRPGACIERHLDDQVG